MDEPIKKANDLLESHGNFVIYTAFVRPIGIFKGTEIISITPCRFFILSQNGSKIKKAYPFTKLTDVSVQDNAITLTFQNVTYTFESNESERILLNIKDVISHCLTIFEQRNININDFTVIPLINQNGFAANCRLHEGISQYPDTEKYLKALEDILIFMQPTLNLANYKNPIEIFYPLLNILPFSPNIKNLEIPKINEIDVYEVIQPLIKNNFFIKYLSIEGERTKHFPEFISLLKYNPDSSMQGHSFKSTNMNKSDLDSLYKYCTEKKIQSLGFHNAIKPECMDYFYNSFLVPELFDTLYILNLSNNNGISKDLRKLFPKLKQVRYLSLSNCQLEISDLLIDISNMKNIKCIDLSHNNCSSAFNKLLTSNARIPSSLDTLILDDVSFKSSCIVPFFSFIFSFFKHGLRLSISSLVTKDETWTQLFDFLSTSSFRSLVSLVWDKNKLSSKLYTFLLNNPYFESLSLNSCLGSSSSESIKSLGIFVQNSNSLKSLSVRGDNERNLGSNLNSLLKMVISSRSLKFLDVSHSKSGDSGLKHIYEFLLSPEMKLNAFVFDDTRPSKSENLVKLLQKVAKMKNKISISFPENDICHLVQQKVIRPEDAKYYRRSFIISQPQLENSKIKENYVINTFFMKPFNIYRYFPEEKFPFLISQKQINDIFKNKHLIENFPASPKKSKVGSPKATPPSSASKRESKDKKSSSSPKKASQSPINIFGDDDDIPEKVKSPSKKVVHQVYDFDTLKEKKENNRSRSPDDTQNLMLNIPKKRYAQSVRSQRSAQNHSEPKETIRRTRTQSTRVRRKDVKQTSSNKKNDQNNNNHDIVNQAKKRRGRSVDSYKNEKKKEELLKETEKNDKKETKKINIIDEYESNDYNFNSSSSSFDLLNETAPILRNRAKNSNSKKPSNFSKTMKKPAVTPSDKKVKIGKNKDKVAPITETKSSKAEVQSARSSTSKTPKRRPNSQLTNYAKDDKKKRVPNSTKSKPRISNEKIFDDIDDDYESGQDTNEVPIKYQSIDWEFPKLKTQNRENEFWTTFKSQFECEKLVKM